MILDDNQIYISGSNNSETTQFSEEMQNDLYEIEDKSWWFQYRAKVISGIASLYFDKSKLTLDVGGGNGFTTSHLLKEGFNIGLLEPSYQGCLNGKKRGIQYIVNGSIEDVKEPQSQYTLLDVLEHIENDAAFLETINDKMEEGGAFLLTVPAFMSLWSIEDVYAGHFRRYKKKELSELLSKHGFEIMYENYFFSFLYLPILIVRVWLGKIFNDQLLKENSSQKRSNSKRQLLWGTKVVNKVLDVLERFELDRLLSNKNLLIGSSLIIVVKKVK